MYKIYIWEITKILMKGIKKDLTNKDIFHIRGLELIILRYLFFSNESLDSVQSPPNPSSVFCRHRQTNPKVYMERQKILEQTTIY